MPVTGPSDLPAVVWSNPEVSAAIRAEAGIRSVGPFTVRLARVDHGECWATRLDDALCYTADSAPCDALDELAVGCRTLLAEASELDSDGPLRGHLTVGDAARLAVRSGTELLVLRHLRGWQAHNALLAEAVGIANCPVLLASPGLRIAVG